MKTFREFISESSEFEQHVSHDPIGVVYHVTSGSGFTSKTLYVMKTAREWVRLEDFRQHGRDWKGHVGAAVNLHTLNITGAEKLLDGLKVGDFLQSPVQLMAVPDHAEFEHDKTKLTYTKHGDKWGTEGKPPVSYLYFDSIYKNLRWSK